MNIMDFFPFVFIRILEEVYPMDLSLQHQTNLVDIVYYQAIAEGICEYDDAVELHKVFNENEEKRL